MRLVERDYIILREVSRWRFCLGRHIKHLAGFSGGRATDRRLKILIEAGLLERKKIIYGIPSVYYLTHKSKALLQLNKRQDKIRIDRIMHDIAVLDTAIYFMIAHNIPLTDITTEKELHSLDGFGLRQHHPDFIFSKDDKINCVEVERTLKAKARMEKIVEKNFLKHNCQYWIVSNTQTKIIELLKIYFEMYPNVEIINLEEVQEFVRNYKPI